MAITGSWRTPDNRWTIDRLMGEDVDWRIYDEGELAAELRGNLDALGESLHRFRVELDDLVPPRRRGRRVARVTRSIGGRG